MASIAIMVGGALLNATAFIGGSYLAKAFGGNSTDKEKKRHDLALEKFNEDREAYLENKEKLQSWLNEREKQAGHASDEFRSTDEALKYYNEMHDDPEIMRAAHEPEFSDYYSPSPDQKNGEMIYVVGGMLALGYGIKGGYEEIPMEEMGHENDGFDEDEEEETSFGGGGNMEEGSIARERERGVRPKTRDDTVTYENPTYEAEGGTGLDDSIFDHRDERQDEAKRRIQDSYPNWDPKNSSFVATVNDKNRVTVSLIVGRKIDSKPYTLFNKDGTLRKGLPKAILNDLGKNVAETLEEVDERESSIDELRREVEKQRKKTEERRRLYDVIERKKYEIIRFGEDVNRKKAKISDLRDIIVRLKEEKDEELEQAKEKREAEVERLKNDYEIHVKELDKFYNDKINDLNRNYEERIKGITDEHGSEMERAKENHEAEIERFKNDYEVRRKELDKLHNDEISSLKKNHVDKVRKISVVFEIGMKQKDKQLSNYEEELGRTQSLLKDSREEVARIERENKTLSTKDQKILEESEMRIEENEERIDELTRENEATLERISLKERVKHIFKKYGVTAFGIITAVGTVIGVVVSNFKSGLAKVAKGVGNGLKELGKKLAQLLPGMIGAIAKYIFNTAGEVVGYLAKNTWLLIVAAVVYAVEQFKKKNK